MRGLSASEWPVLAEAWTLLLYFYLALLRTSLVRLEEKVPRRPAAPRPDMDPERIKRLLDLASRLHFFSATCLVRSLALRWMFTRRGLDAVLRIGVARAPGGMQAHAWIETNGSPVGEPPDVAKRFIVLGSAASLQPGTRLV